MIQPTDARCDGINCPSQALCLRYTERQAGDFVVKAAAWCRRESGDTACDMVIWANPVTTYCEPHL